MPAGIPVSTREGELFGIVDTLKSDPFIPRSIRNKLVDFFQNRAEVMSQVFMEVIDQYRDALAKGKYWDTLDTNQYWIHNKILDGMNARGCGIAQIEEEVHKLRNNIQDYLEQFDPIKKTKS